MKKFILFSLIVLFLNLVQALDPSQQEKDFYNELEKRFNLHKDLVPLPVDQAIGTMSKELELTFNCPNPPPQKGRIKIKTNLVAWGQQANEAGHYDWKCSVQVNQEEKLLECENEISFDLSKMLPENNLAKQADNVRIFYHEWLHSQLLINAMQTAAWQKDFCSCNVDLKPADLDDPHTVIPTLDMPFMENLTSRIVNMKDPWNMTTENNTDNNIPEFNEWGLMLVLLSIAGIFLAKKDFNKICQ